MEINEVLADRAKTHGNFADHAQVCQDLQDIMKGSVNWPKLTPAMKEALEMVMHKAARILSGDPSHPDHWFDIAGYSMRVNQLLTETINPSERHPC